MSALHLFFPPHAEAELSDSLTLREAGIQHGGRIGMRADVSQSMLEQHQKVARDAEEQRRAVDESNKAKEEEAMEKKTASAVTLSAVSAAHSDGELMAMEPVDHQQAQANKRRRSSDFNDGGDEEVAADAEVDGDDGRVEAEVRRTVGEGEAPSSSPAELTVHSDTSAPMLTVTAALPGPAAAHSRSTSCEGGQSTCARQSPLALSSEVDHLPLEAMAAKDGGEAEEETAASSSTSSESDVESEPKFEEAEDDGLYRYTSMRYAWLPADFDVSSDGSVRCLSYINGLHPVHHSALYSTIEALLARFIPMFERVLTELREPRLRRVPIGNGYHDDSDDEAVDLWAQKRRDDQRGDMVEDADEEDSEMEDRDSEEMNLQDMYREQRPIIQPEALPFVPLLHPPPRCLCVVARCRSSSSCATSCGRPIAPAMQAVCGMWRA